MTLVLAVTVGALFALGTFLLLRADLLKVVWGLAILSQAVNVYLLASGGIRAGDNTSVPVLQTHHAPFPETVDPLVQALVLTAIVISFGVTAFALTLSYRAYQEHGTIDLRDWPAIDAAGATDSVSARNSGTAADSRIGTDSGTATDSAGGIEEETTDDTEGGAPR
jgi:multicomponent Na+:H+ antiporter subunit C